MVMFMFVEQEIFLLIIQGISLMMAMEELYNLAVGIAQEGRGVPASTSLAFYFCPGRFPTGKQSPIPFFTFLLQDFFE